MEVQYESGSITTTASSSAGTSASVNLPSGASGKRILVALATNANTTHSAPSGWALVQSSTDTTVRVSVYYNYQSTAPAFTSTLGASSDWAAISLAFDGANTRGFATLSNIADFSHWVGYTASSAATTHTAASINNGYADPGRCRVVFGAYSSATTGGFSSASFGGVAAEDLTNVSSSGATPVRLAMAIESYPSAVGGVAPSMTSAVSTGDLAMVAVSMRPKTRTSVYYGSASAVSTTADTAVTQPSRLSISAPYPTIFMSCMNNGAQQFNWSAPWVLIDGVTTGNLRHEIWMLQPHGTSSSDWPLSATLGAACDWGVNLTYVSGVPFSSTPLTDVVRSSSLVTDTASGTSLTSGTVTNGARGDAVLVLGAATGASQTISSFSTTFTDTALVAFGSTITSSGSPRAAGANRGLICPVAAGATGTFTMNTSVATTEKSLWCGVIRSADSFESAGVLLC